MRDCLRNQRTIWYALYDGKEPVMVNGLDSGQNKEIYSKPKMAEVNVASATGGAETELFGASVQYDRVISTVQDLPIDEYSRIWVDTIPNEQADNSDYKVKQVAKGLDQHLWAIEKVVRNGY